MVEHVVGYIEHVVECVGHVVGEYGVERDEMLRDGEEVREV